MKFTLYSQTVQLLMELAECLPHVKETATMHRLTRRPTTYPRI